MASHLIEINKTLGFVQRIDTFLIYPMPATRQTNRMKWHSSVGHGMKNRPEVVTVQRTAIDCFRRWYKGVKPMLREICDGPKFDELKPLRKLVTITPFRTVSAYKLAPVV